MRSEPVRPPVDRRCRGVAPGGIGGSSGLRAALPIALVSALAVASCSSDGTADGSGVTRTDSAGVEIVRNRGPSRTLDWTFRRLFTLGGREEGAESFYELSSGSIDTDPAGRIYVLDASGGRVAVFDTAGRALRTMGRPGEGPGELEQPFQLTVGPGDTVFVFDFPKRGFVRFAPDGSVMETVPLGLPYFGGRIAATDDALVLRVGEFGGNRRRVLALSRSDTSEIAVLESPEARVISFESCPMRFSGMGPIFYPGLTYDAGGPRVFVNREAEYRVDVFSGGRKRASWRRDVSLRDATLAMAIRQIGDAMQLSAGGRTLSCDGEEVARKRGHAETLPAVEDLVVAPDGTVWIQRGHVRGEPFEVDLLAADGRYLGTLPPGSPWPVAFVSPRTLVAVERDDLDVERAVVYRVRERPEGP